MGALMSGPVGPILGFVALLSIAACAHSQGKPVAASPPPPLPLLNGAFGAPIGPALAPLPSEDARTAPSVAGGAMAAPDITASLAGSTGRGITTNGAPYTVYFAPDGQEQFRQGSFADTGIWRALPDGRFCSALPQVSGGSLECYFLYRSGNVFTFQRPDGVTVGSFAVTSDQPERL